jgi:hypothetical protein
LYLNFFLPSIKQKREKEGEKNIRNIKSFNEQPTLFVQNVLNGGGFRARNITLAREDWQN